jgi:hypothetical protein
MKNTAESGKSLRSKTGAQAVARIHFELIAFWKVMRLTS